MYTVSIHAFRGEGDFGVVYVFNSVVVSIHAFRGEGDGLAWVVDRVRARFQSTPSGGKATGVFASCVTPALFQSTPSGGKATAISRAAVPCSRQIL